MTSETRSERTCTREVVLLGEGGSCQEPTAPPPFCLPGEGNVPDPKHHHGVSGVR